MTLFFFSNDRRRLYGNSINRPRHLVSVLTKLIKLLQQKLRHSRSNIKTSRINQIESYKMQINKVQFI